MRVRRPELGRHLQRRIVRVGLRRLREGAFGVAAQRAAHVGLRALPEQPLPPRPFAVGGGVAAVGEPRQDAQQVAAATAL